MQPKPVSPFIVFGGLAAATSALFFGLWKASTALVSLYLLPAAAKHLMPAVAKWPVFKAYKVCLFF